MSVPESKSTRKYTVEFGDLDEKSKETPEPVLTKQARSIKPREFEIKEVVEVLRKD